MLSRRHAEHYTALAEGAEQQPAAAVGQSAWAGLEEEQDNFRAALDWSHHSGELELELRLVGALAYHWLIQARLSEGRSRLDAALTHEHAPASLRAKALFGAARLANSLGDDEGMREYTEGSLAAYRSLGDQWGIARSLDALGIAVSNLGDLSRGIALNKESAAIYRTLGDDQGLAVSLNNLGSVLLREGQPEDARVLIEEALAVFEALGRRDRMPVPLGNLGVAALLDDRPHDALGLFRQGLAVAYELDYTEALIYGLEGVAAALAASGAVEPAATLLGAAGAAAEAASIVLEPLEHRIHDETSKTLKDALGEETFAAINAAGRRITLSDAATYALGKSQLPVSA